MVIFFSNKLIDTIIDLMKMQSSNCAKVDDTFLKKYLKFFFSWAIIFFGYPLSFSLNK